MKELLHAVWDGFRLMCPSCRRGPIFKNRREMHITCPSCGAVLYRADDADWLIAWLSAYTGACLVLIGVVVLLQLYTDLNLWTQIAISSVVAGLVLATCYPFFKGSAVGVLYFMRNRWKE